VGITLLAFLLSALAPGDPARSFFIRTNGRPPSSEELLLVRERFDLNDALPQRYLHWLGRAVHGNLGDSYSTGEPVTQELVSRFPATLELAVTATLLALLIAIPLGVLAAVKRNSVLDQVLRGAALLAASIPGYWLALLLIILFSVKLHLLPSFGRDGIRSLILPALSLGLGDAAVVARLTRSSLLEVLGQDYITTARAKGISEIAVILRHGLRNALGVVITEAGLLLAFFLAYSAIVEVIFVWPGIGRLAVGAIGQRDYTMIQGFVVFAGSVFVLINLVVDLAYLRLDPRIVLTGRAKGA
jgi:ABC-type dipeptide/oligopeptide/nickel transport system permease component